ncbi:MAG: rane protein [Segetibacter sp.]|nr:rane protein [Segetibacter sp.]
MNLKRLLYALVLPLLLFAAPIFAQDKVVTGRVTDAAGVPITNASIVVKGGTTGTQSTADGSFSIRVPATATTLVVSSVGFGTREVPIESGTIAVTLTAANATLNEVVVVGYGTRQRRDLTGSVTTISTKDFQKGTITSPEQLIAGKVAGVQITTNGGAPGAGSSIRIRGGASLSATNDPLIVVDGVPLDNGGIAGSANALSLINPNDIESFNILKDASAAAIYGSRASNGVIIITTKKGRRGKPAFTFSTNLSASTNRKQVEVLSGDQLREVIGKQGNANAKSLLGTANTNWQDEIFKTAWTNDNNLSVGGSIGAVPYRLSLGHLNQQGILRTGYLKRTSAALNLSPSLFTNHLKINLNLKGSLADTKFANEGAIGSAIAFNPTVPVRQGTRFGGFFEWVDPTTNNPNFNSPRNPVALLEQREDVSDVQRSIGNVQFDYSFHFLPELHANLNLGYDAAQGTGNVFIPDSVAVSYARGGVNNQYRQEKTNKLLESYLSYNKELPSIKSRFDVVAGYSYQDFKTKDFAFADFNARGAMQPNTEPRFAFNIPQNTLISFFGRLNYTFNNKYLLSASLRNDGSSRFAPENRWGLFPAVALAWRIKDEKFLTNSKTLSDLKLRVGYGITGQQDIGAERYYSYLGTYSISNQFAQYQFGNQFYNMYRPAGYNPNLKWEETETINAGFDFGFVNNRINGTLDFYYKKTTDLLNLINQPSGSNFSNEIIANIGSMENRGIELNLNASPIRNSRYSWDVNFNVTYNKNEITKLTAFSDSSYPGVQHGTVAGGINNTVQVHSVGSARSSFFVFKQVYDQSGKPIEGLYEDLNGDGVINRGDLYRYKNIDPKVFLGFSTNLTRGKWNGGFTVRGSIGNYIYNNVYSNTGVYRNIYNLPNFVNNASINYLETGFQNNQVLSDYYVQNGSFLRMDNVFIGYNAGKIFGNTTLNITGNVQNVFVITEYKGLDPEISGGIDNQFYPRPRIYTLGLTLNF